MPLTNAEVDAAVPFGAGEQPDRQLTNAALKELITDIAAKIGADVAALASLVTIQGITVTLADAGADSIFGWDDSEGAYKNLAASDVRIALALTALATTTPASGITSWLAAPSSANLLAAMTDKSGDGLLMFLLTGVTLSGATNLSKATHGGRYLNCDTAATLTVLDDTAGGWDTPGDMLFGRNTSGGNVVLAADSTGTTNTVTADDGYTLTVPSGAPWILWRTAANAWKGGAFIGPTATQTLSGKRITKRESTAASSSSLTIASDSTDVQTVTALAADMTINAPSGTPTQGQGLVLRIKATGASRNLTWTTGSAGAFREMGASLPASVAQDKTVYVGSMYNTTDSRWDVLVVNEEP